MSAPKSRSFRALEKAARDGSPEAQYHLAAYLATGEGCEKDVMAAADWYAKAAAQRQPEALYNLGLMHLLGEIGKKAPRKGFALIRQGAEFGSWDAHWFLWQVYAGGLHGQAKSNDKAAYHLLACVGFRYGNAVNALARQLKKRDGIKPDALARAFLKLALPRRGKIHAS